MEYVARRGIDSTAMRTASAFSSSGMSGGNPITVCCTIRCTDTSSGGISTRSNPVISTPFSDESALKSLSDISGTANGTSRKRSSHDIFATPSP